MNQDLISGDSNLNKTGTTSFSTGSICPKTGLYKTSDGKMEFIEFYGLNDIFRNYPGGNGTKKCSWTRLTLATDGGQRSFEGVKVDAGTV